MSHEKTLGYAAVITVEIPNNPTPFEVSVMLFPADAIDTAAKESSKGTFKILRECTLSDLVAFADHLQDEMIEEFAQTPLSTFARPGHGSVRVRLPQHVGAEIDDRDHWWRTTRVALIKTLQQNEESPLPEPHIMLMDQAAEEQIESANGDEEGAEPVDGESASEIDLESGDDQPVNEAELDQGDLAEPAIEPTPSDEPAVEAPAPVQAPSTPADFLQKIVVSDPEPVFEEREIDEDEAAEAVHVIERKDTENRLAGTRLPLDDPTPAAVDILFDEHPFRQAQDHASSSMTREVAGMLVGPPPEKQPNGRYVVHVTDVIAAKHTRMQGASVTYTPESWRYVNDVLRERYPDEECVIVGWYHTHPGFGIFLSNMDLFIHHNFFTQKWHVALVLDPVGQRSGFFTWDRPQSEVMAYHFPWPYWAHSSW